MRVLYLSNLNSKISTVIFQPIKSNYRADIIDNSGNFLVKSVRTIDVGINPNLIMDKKKLIINLQLIFQNKDFSTIKKKIYKNKFFYLKKKLAKKNMKNYVYLVKNLLSLKKNYQESILKRTYLAI